MNDYALIKIFFDMNKYKLLLFLFVNLAWSRSSHAANEQIHYQVLSWDWTDVKFPITVGIWILVACIVKIGKKKYS